MGPSLFEEMVMDLGGLSRKKLLGMGNMGNNFNAQSRLNVGSPEHTIGTLNQQIAGTGPGLYSPGTSLLQSDQEHFLPTGINPDTGAADITPASLKGQEYTREAEERARKYREANPHLAGTWQQDLDTLHQPLDIRYDPTMTDALGAINKCDHLEAQRSGDIKQLNVGPITSHSAKDALRHEATHATQPVKRNKFGLLGEALAKEGPDALRGVTYDQNRKDLMQEFTDRGASAANASYMSDPREMEAHLSQAKNWYYDKYKIVPESREQIDQMIDEYRQTPSGKRSIFFGERMTPQDPAKEMRFRDQAYEITPGIVSNNLHQNMWA